MPLTYKPITQFKAGGTLDPDHPTYLPRITAQKLLEVCHQGEFAYLFTARQVGKSSLVVGVQRELQTEKIDAILIDLTSLGSNFKTIDDWYFSILTDLINALDLNIIDLNTFWEQKNRLQPTQRFNQFLEKQLLPQINQALVIFLDEIDSMLSYDFTNEVMANIRSLYNARVSKPIFNKMTFVLIGVATPDDLINDLAKTPFNIGQRLELVDFTQPELENYRFSLVNKHPHYGNQYFHEIFEWVHGHPYLTQKLCGLALNSSPDDKANLVEILIKQHFINQSNDPNISFVSKAITNEAKPDLAEAMLQRYRRLIIGDQVKDDVQSTTLNHLKLTGIVVANDSVLQFRNKLYQTIFDEYWVEQKLREFQDHLEKEKLKQEKEKLLRQLYHQRNQYLFLLTVTLIVLVIAIFIGIRFL